MSRLQTHCAESTLLRRARRDLPPGGLHPSLLQTLAARFAPYAYFEQCHRRLGDRFTLYPIDHPPLVMLANPADIEAVTASDPCELRPGEGSKMIEPPREPMPLAVRPIAVFPAAVVPVTAPRATAPAPPVATMPTPEPTHAMSLPPTHSLASAPAPTAPATTEIPPSTPPATAPPPMMTSPTPVARDASGDDAHDAPYAAASCGVCEGEWVVANVAVGFAGNCDPRVAGEELSGGGVVGACAHVDESGVDACVLGVISKRCRSGAFAGRGAVGAVGAFPGDSARGARDQPRAAGLIVMQIGHGAGAVVDLLDCCFARTVDEGLRSGRRRRHGVSD